MRNIHFSFIEMIKKISHFFQHMPGKKLLSVSLIATLLISQTVQVSFFDRASAGPESYHDIVSIVIDKETYRELRDNVNQYAKNVSGYLGGVRTSILVVNPGTSPAMIASKNEKLYAEGDGGAGISNLVGTVLIGNIPIPMVQKKGSTFPSLYPYVDFVDKAFVYDYPSKGYIANTQLSPYATESPEIWHGVVNPAVGREWNSTQDIPKIKQFLEKTQDFYKKSGKFAPSNTPPKVFYFDGYSEQASVTQRSILQYGLYMNALESIVYNRFTKYLLSDINNVLKKFDKKSIDPDVAEMYQSLGVDPGTDTLTPEQIRQTPDIKTREITLSFVKNFQGIFNTKTLGNELAAVRNAGRYNAGKHVRADLVPTSVTIMDTIAKDVILSVNNSLEKKIDDLLKTHNYTRRIPIFNELRISKGSPFSMGAGGLGQSFDQRKSSILQGYFFGQKATNITHPSQCTIARGAKGDITPFGRSQLVEANTAFDIGSTQKQLDMLKKDTEVLVPLGKGTCFDGGTPRIQSYWGGNSVLRVAHSKGDADEVFNSFPSPTRFKGLTAPIFSLGGMRETDRLPAGSLKDCLPGGFGYALAVPRVMAYTTTKNTGGKNGSTETVTCTRAYPSEWMTHSFESVCGNRKADLGGDPKAPRYTCISNVSANITDTSLSTFGAHAFDFPAITALFLGGGGSSRTFRGGAGVSGDCHYGNLVLDGTAVLKKRNRCIIESKDDDGTTTEVDVTDYKDIYYHSIPSIYKHISPTKEEISSAEGTQVTPSLPVDIKRYVEFMTPKGNIARLNYPNFFEIQGHDVASVRAWIKSISDKDWNAIIAKENTTTLNASQQKAAQILGGVGAIPQNPIDWNNYISDDTIVRLLQARRWLQPDVSTKYKETIAHMLSYSRANVTNLDPNTPPSIPSVTTDYEIAYIGIPENIGLENRSAHNFAITEAYQTGRREIEGANISQEIAPVGQTGGSSAGGKSDTDCGPPEGVPIWRWLPAIMCWISKQLPPRIMAGSCGPNTIGMDNDSNSRPISRPANEANIDERRAFYEGATVLPQMARSSMQPRDSMVINTILQKKDQYLAVEPDTTTTINIVSMTKGGQPVDVKNYKQYLSVSSMDVPVGERGASFVIQSHNENIEAKLQITYRIPFTDRTSLILKSSTFDIRVTNEYYNILVSQSGSTAGVVDATIAETTKLTIQKISKNGIPVDATKQLFVNIRDDINNNLVYSGKLDKHNPVIPQQISKKIGVYRMYINDDDGIVGEVTFVVNAGALSQVRVVPLSTALIRGNTGIATVRLLDRLGSPIAANLHTVKIEAQGGYLVDASGKKVKQMTMDIMEPAFPIAIGSNTPGVFHIRVTVDDTIKNSTEIRVHDTARVVLKPSKLPRIGGGKVPMRLEIQDAKGVPIAGLSSVATLVLPKGAGVFSKNIIPITDGISQGFEYIPGTVSGNHKITIQIPGVATLTDVGFMLAPGDAMYIDHTYTDNSLQFVLRDRYGNVSDQSFVGTLSYNGEKPVTINFSKGVYVATPRNGYYTIEVPDLLKNRITYKDASGTHHILGIPKYVTHIVTQRDKIDFAPDYNARYTVLAGGSFLREGEDILYNTTPGQSQSLAVTTTMEHGYTENILASILPGGAFTLGNGIDTALDATISIDNSFPLLTVYDQVRKTQAFQVLYRMKDARLQACQSGNTCDILVDTPTIKLQAQSSDYRAVIDKNTITLKDHQGVSYITIGNDGSISTFTSIVLVPDASKSKKGLHISIMYNGIEIGTLTYQMDIRLSVNRGNSIQFNTPQIIVATNSIRSKSFHSLTSGIYGYEAFQPQTTRTLDESKKGPNDTDPIHFLQEIPGVGWQGNNTMLLSYAGGDTVGESTKFFHTYTMINMGDPVTHVDNGIDPITKQNIQRPGTQIDGIDRSVGSVITRAKRAGIASFHRKDLNADNIDDIIVIYADGYIELFLNLRGKFRSRGMIAYLPGLDPKKTTFGDFTNDGYADILTVNKDRNFVLINNDGRKFARKDIVLADDTAVPQNISQFKIYDMDADGRDDIVYIAANGELAILYGTETSGIFTRNILDTTLGISLSPEPLQIGGAIFSPSIPSIQSFAPKNTPSTATPLSPVSLSPDNTMSYTPENAWVLDDKAVEKYYASLAQKTNQTTSGLSDNDDTDAPMEEDILFSQVLYQYRHTMSAPSSATDLDGLTNTVNDVVANKNSTIKNTMYVRSQYAPAYNLSVDKKYTHTNKILHPSDQVTTTIRIKNTGTTTLKNIEYLDTLPRIFSHENTKNYTVTLDGKSVTRSFNAIGDVEFDAHFYVGDIAPGKTVEISYTLIALPASYGEMIVGDLEKGTAGADAYGDVGFKSSTTCGAGMLVWLSGPGSRDYTRTTHEFGKAQLPSSIASKLVDSDKNNIPDSIENLSISDRQQMFTDLAKSSSPHTDNSLISIDSSADSINIGINPSAMQEIETITQNLLDGLACGFGGGSCMSFPINWAPMAPGNSPFIMGQAVASSWMSPSGGPTSIPIFSALTAINVPTPAGCYQIPVIWPASPFQYTGVCNTTNGAGGTLGVNSPTNFFRLFVTPTLTMGVGAGMCLTGPARQAGKIPPKGLSPFIQGGNCIVMAKPMSVCKGDGSADDGNVSGISGLGTISDTWNSASCTIEANTNGKTSNKKLTNDIIKYLKNPKSRELNKIYGDIQQQGSTNTQGPLLRIGSGDPKDAMTLEIDTSAAKVADIGKVIKLKNKRIAPFPEFIMDWVSRQIEEITTSLFTPPSLTIIPPTDFGQNAQVDTSYGDFFNKLGASYSKANFDNIKQNMSEARANTTSDPNSPRMMHGAKANLNAIKTAYAFIGKLPFINVREVTIPINIPWIKMNELDRYKRAWKGYKNEVMRAADNLCVTDPSAECLAKKAKIQNGAFMNSINQNLQRIEEYKRFPQKLQKYLTWKERYIAQIMCNIDTIQEITTGWLKDNGVRFRKWAELYVLIKAIAQSWQPLLDVFNKTSESCGVCRNERYNSQSWKFKLISMITPKIPVIKFPKWPDIILDLSDIRFGIDIALPNFDPRISPIRLPDLPSLSIGDIGLSVGLPEFGVLPPLPDLPDLPDLPSLPKVKFPDLPPPPKIPKLAGFIKFGVKIMKLISKMYCYYQKTMLIPEWQVGDVIAQRTERQGTLPFDFIDIQMPQFSLPTLKEIRIATHVNFELRADFIAEFARSAVKPINQFQTDLQKMIPQKVGTDISVPSKNIDLKLESFNFETDIGTGIIADMILEMKKDIDTFVDVDDFKTLVYNELEQAGLNELKHTVKKQIYAVGEQTKAIQKELITHNNHKWDQVRHMVKLTQKNDAKLQHIIDLLQKDIDASVAPLASQTYRDTQIQSALSRLNQHQSRTLKSENTDMNVGLVSSREQLLGRLDRMMAAHATNTPSHGAGNTTAGYAPNYQGVYIKTPLTGVQTRLFDYMSPIRSDTRVQSADMDGDGDTDYMFVLNDILYIKYSHHKTPNRRTDHAIKVTEVGPKSKYPYVPNNLYGDPKTTKSLNFSFSTANPTERQWRAEVYDRYIEWDQIAMKRHNERLSPRLIIDLFANSDTQESSNEIQVIPVDRYIQSIGDPQSFAIKGRRIDIYTGSLSIAISPGRTLYTGNQSVEIQYKNTTTGQQGSMTLNPHKGYSFGETLEITASDAHLYLIGEEDGSRYAYSDDLIGMPLLTGMNIYASDAGMTVRDVTHQQLLSLPQGATYMTYDLGAPTGNYSVNVPYIDGLYYLRLQSLTQGERDRSDVILLSPQLENDTGAPIVDFPSKIRVPVYLNRTYAIKDIIIDLNRSSVKIDEDITVDANGDGIHDNDFSGTGSHFALTDNSLIIGPFDAPGTYHMSMQVTDEAGNVTVSPLVIEVYTPIPEIKNVTKEGFIQGTIDITDKKEPIHFFRIRPSNRPILLSMDATPTQEGGSFSSGSFFQDPERYEFGSKTSHGSMTSRGVFTLPTGYTLDMAPMTFTQPMRFLIKNSQGTIDYAHVLSAPNVKILDALDPKNTHATGALLVTLADNIRMVGAKSNDPVLPNGLYITDRNYKAIAGITHNGNISLMDSKLSLQYIPKGIYFAIKIVQDTKVLATIEYRLDLFYTTK